jgi:rhodanese-related sulfurtransferase
VLERDAPKVLPDPNEKIVLYCGGGARSALAADVLRQMGYARPISMMGGFGNWVEEGLPVVQ